MTSPRHGGFKQLITSEVKEDLLIPGHLGRFFLHHLNTGNKRACFGFCSRFVYNRPQPHGNNPISKLKTRFLREKWVKHEMSDISKARSGQEARLQKIRSLLSKKRPKFHRPESWRYKRVKEKWRRARGIDSRTRRKKRGWPVSPSIGYRSPVQVRYQSSAGKEEVLINSPLDLSLMDTSYQVGRIGASVGRKKKEKIITEAQLLNVHIVNPIVARVDLRDLEEELALDEEALEDLELSDLELSDLETGGEEE